MSYPINQNLTPKYQPAMGVNGTAPLQNVDPEKIQQGITQNSALKGVAGGEESNNGATALLTIPAFIGMALGMDKFNKACGGEYEKSLMGKIAAWADRVGGNKFFQSKQAEAAGAKFTSLKEFINKKVINESRILSAMFNTPSEPTNKMVRMMKKGTQAELSADAIQKMEEHVKQGGKLTLNGVEQEAKELEKLAKESHSTEGIEKIMKMCEENRDITVNGKKFGKLPKWISKEGKYISQFKGMQWLGDLLGRDVNFAEYANKMKAFDNGAKTWLGKTLPKFTLRLVEGLTNGTAGGKIAILMGAYFVADAIKKTFDAPKGEKTSTFSENLVYNEAMYLTMPLGLKIMHGMGGLQYIGVNDEQLKKYRTAQTEFNAEVLKGDKGIYANKAAYDTARKNIKSILKPEIKGNGFTKFMKGMVFEPLKAAARFLTVGLENFESFNPKGISKASSLGERLGQFFKNGKAKGFKWALGGPTRFIFYLFLIAPPLGKLGAKASHLVFGRPTKSVLDEGKEEEKDKAKTPQVIMPNQAVPAAQVLKPMQQNPAATQMNTVQGGNLVDMYKPSTQSNQKSMTVPQEPVRSYIPSSEGVKIDPNSDNKNAVGLAVPEIEVAMNKADGAEERANKFAH